MSDYRSMFDRKYLGAWDLAKEDGTPRDVVLTIREVKAELLSNKSGSTKKPVVYFEGTDRAFALNKSNGATIAAMYGNNTKAWAGKRIKLYATQVNFGPQTVDAIRVRPTIPNGASSNGIAHREVDPEMRAQQEAAADAAEKEQAS